jgi:hypothetical protein
MSLGTVHVGLKLVFRTAEFFGNDFRGKKPRFDGQTLEVIGFAPRLKNNVVVPRSARGRIIVSLRRH